MCMPAQVAAQTVGQRVVVFPLGDVGLVHSPGVAASCHQDVDHNLSKTEVVRARIGPEVEPGIVDLNRRLGAATETLDGYQGAGW